MGENNTFVGGEDWLQAKGVQVVNLSRFEAHSRDPLFWTEAAIDLLHRLTKVQRPHGSVHQKVPRGVERRYWRRVRVNQDYQLPNLQPGNILRNSTLIAQRYRLSS